MSQESDTAGPRSRRRQASKPAKPLDGEKVKVTLYLPADLAKRFTVHAAMTGQDKSALFAELVRNGCKRFVISDRGQGDQVEPEVA